jgi:TrmH family RNA methyltransferase
MIESRQNQTLKDIRRLRRSKGDTALLEGPHLVAEARALGLPFEVIVTTPEFAESPRGRELFSSITPSPLLVAAELLADLADADAPRGVLAVLHLPRAGAEILPTLPGSVYCYLDGVQDPGNLGALVRVAEASGAAGIALSPLCAHPNHPRALRASAGSLLRVPVAMGVEPADLDRRLASLAPQWLALAPRGGEDLFGAPLEGTLIVALGAEGPGVSEAILARATRKLTIPIQAPVESLNVTVAAALTLFEVRRRRLLAARAT